MKANTFLGQHFLTSRAVVQKIIKAADIQTDDVILEVGPGKGTLTSELVKHAGRVIAIEKDGRLVDFLREKFGDVKNIEITHGDILKPGTWGMKLETRDPKPETQNLKLETRNARGEMRNAAPKLQASSFKFQATGYKIVANIPYYITSRFLRLFLEEIAPKPVSMVLMIQKEVAERILARAPDMNLLGLSVQAFGKPRIIARVSKGQFSPPPEVDSAVIAIEHISNDFFEKRNLEPKTFFAVAKKAFSQKRKMLRSSLGITGVLATKRPQELSREDFAQIATGPDRTQTKAQNKR